MLIAHTMSHSACVCNDKEYAMHCKLGLQKYCCNVKPGGSISIDGQAMSYCFTQACSIDHATVYMTAKHGSRMTDLGRHEHLPVEAHLSAKEL